MKIKFVTGTVIVRAAFVSPSFQTPKVQPLVDVAVIKILVPTGYVPPPVTVPPSGGAAWIRIVTGGMPVPETASVFVPLIASLLTVNAPL